MVAIDMIRVVIVMKLEELTKDELLDLAYFNHDKKEYILLSMKSKQEVYDYVVKNLEHILGEIKRFAFEDISMDLECYFEDSDKCLFSEDEYYADFDVSRKFLEALHLIKVKKKKGDYEVSISRELANKLMVDSVDDYLSYYEQILDYLNVYGVVEVCDLEKLISCEDLSYILGGFSRLYQTFYIFSLNGKKLVCHPLFNSLDKAFDFYDLSDKVDLKVKVVNIYDLASYKKLMDFVKKEFFVSYYDFDSDYYEFALSEFTSLFVIPYLEARQIDDNDAVSDLSEELNLYIDLDDRTFLKLVNLLDDVYSDLPKWKLGGKIK